MRLRIEVAFLSCVRGTSLLTPAPLGDPFNLLVARAQTVSNVSPVAARKALALASFCQRRMVTAQWVDSYSMSRSCRPVLWLQSGRAGTAERIQHDLATVRSVLDRV